MWMRCSLGAEKGVNESSWSYWEHRLQGQPASKSQPTAVPLCILLNFCDLMKQTLLMPAKCIMKTRIKLNYFAYKYLICIYCCCWKQSWIGEYMYRLVEWQKQTSWQWIIVVQYTELGTEIMWEPRGHPNQMDRALKKTQWVFTSRIR